MKQDIVVGVKGAKGCGIAREPMWRGRAGTGMGGSDGVLGTEGRGEGNLVLVCEGEKGAGDSRDWGRECKSLKGLGA